MLAPQARSGPPTLFGRPGRSCRYGTVTVCLLRGARGVSKIILQNSDLHAPCDTEGLEVHGRLSVGL